MDEFFIKKAYKKAKKHSDNKPLSKCLAYPNAIGFLFEYPGEVTYGGPGYILVYDDGTVKEMPTNIENQEFFSQGILIDASELPFLL